MSTETILWGVLAAIGTVGGVLLLAALWSIIKYPKQR